MSWIDFDRTNFENGAHVFGKIAECFKQESYKRGKPYRVLSAGIISGSNDSYAYYPFKKGKKKADLLSSIKEALGDNVHPMSVMGNVEDYSSVYSDDFYLSTIFYDEKVKFTCYSFNDELSQKVADVFSSHINFKEKKNSNVYMLMNGADGLAVEYMGSFKKKLNKKNYSKEVLDSFANCIREIKKKTPRGRLSVLYGPPGTGKTYLLRSVINAIPNGTFFSVQPEVFKKNDGATIMKTLSQYKNQKLVLLIEDADSILCDRKNNSEDVVSNILNLTDGFMGECLDINIVATTNIKKLEIDKALRRRGRMNSFIEIGPLEPEEAQAAYDAIKTKDKPDFTFTEPTILANVYAKSDPEAEDEGVEEIANQERRIGFGASFTKKKSEDGPYKVAATKELKPLPDPNEGERPKFIKKH